MAMITAAGGTAAFVCCDVTDDESLVAAIGASVELFGDEISASVCVVGGGPDGARGALLSQSSASYLGVWRHVCKHVRGHG